jgi:hypothetical protein
VDGDKAIVFGGAVYLHGILSDAKFIPPRKSFTLQRFNT